MSIEWLIEFILLHISTLIYTFSFSLFEVIIKILGQLAQYSYKLAISSAFHPNNVKQQVICYDCSELNEISFILLSIDVTQGRRTKTYK